MCPFARTNERERVCERERAKEIGRLESIGGSWSRALLRGCRGATFSRVNNVSRGRTWKVVTQRIHPTKPFFPTRIFQSPKFYTFPHRFSFSEIRSFLALFLRTSSILTPPRFYPESRNYHEIVAHHDFTLSDSIFLDFSLSNLVLSILIPIFFNSRWFSALPSCPCVCVFLFRGWGASSEWPVTLSMTRFHEKYLHSLLFAQTSFSKILSDRGLYKDYGNVYLFFIIFIRLFMLSRVVFEKRSFSVVYVSANRLEIELRTFTKCCHCRRSNKVFFSLIDFLISTVLFISRRCSREAYFFVSKIFEHFEGHEGH